MPGFDIDALQGKSLVKGDARMVPAAVALRGARLTGLLRQLGAAGVLCQRLADRSQRRSYRRRLHDVGVQLDFQLQVDASPADDAVHRRGAGLRRRRTRPDRVHALAARYCDAVCGPSPDSDVLTPMPLALVPVLLFLAGWCSRQLQAAPAAHGAAAGGSRRHRGRARATCSATACCAFPGDFTAYSRYVSPWIEETLKAVVLVFLIRTRRVGLPVDAGIAGFAIGTGFALVENLYYLASRPAHSRCRCRSSAVSAPRSCTAARRHDPGHDLGRLYERRPSGRLAVTAARIPGGGRAAYRLQLHAGAPGAGHAGDAGGAAARHLPRVPAQRTHAPQLARPGSRFQAAAARGHHQRQFLDSPAGRYLRSLSDRFQGEDLADMLCLLRLHGELALRAKGVLLLRESGLDEPPLDAETRDKLAELDPARALPSARPACCAASADDGHRQGPVGSSTLLRQ